MNYKSVSISQRGAPDVLQVVEFDWLAQGQISPIIAHKLPLLEAAKANEWLENGHVRGKIVLLAPERQPITSSQRNPWQPEDKIIHHK